MEKYIEIFCKQNPMTDIECMNPKCKSKTKIRTKDFLKTKYTYKYHCPKCGSDNLYDTKDFYKKLEIFKHFC